MPIHPFYWLGPYAGSGCFVDGSRIDPLGWLCKSRGDSVEMTFRTAKRTD